ncbi:hypothetical protein GALMADRAFT_283779 [Galerina marginata CBS 339.88]|uniref:Uncharacterized protein n=1 Tax=Galerina marginata (strain CBS 339.88) TaxID=685588 RepID=A0A067S9S0_GALM3|nr:hypothetical protein GALMADRAFT_283779 [Galerina marginata CBS 339.88]
MLPDSKVRGSEAREALRERGGEEDAQAQLPLASLIRARKCGPRPQELARALTPSTSEAIPLKHAQSTAQERAIRNGEEMSRQLLPAPGEPELLPRFSFSFSLASRHRARRKAAPAPALRSTVRVAAPRQARLGGRRHRTQNGEGWMLNLLMGRSYAQAGAGTNENKSSSSSPARWCTRINVKEAHAQPLGKRAPIQNPKTAHPRRSSGGTGRLTHQQRRFRRDEDGRREVHDKRQLRPEACGRRAGAEVEARKTGSQFDVQLLMVLVTWCYCWGRTRLTIDEEGIWKIVDQVGTASGGGLKPADDRRLRKMYDLCECSFSREEAAGRRRRCARCSSLSTTFRPHTSSSTTKFVHPELAPHASPVEGRPRSRVDGGRYGCKDAARERWFREQARSSTTDAMTRWRRGGKAECTTVHADLRATVSAYEYVEKEWTAKTYCRGKKTPAPNSTLTPDSKATRMFASKTRKRRRGP